MSRVCQDLYRSENGDTWRLIRDAASGQVLVRHEANLASGGHVTEVAAEDFLRRDGSGPEYAAARRLLATPLEIRGPDIAGSFECSTVADNNRDAAQPQNSDRGRQTP